MVKQDDHIQALIELCWQMVKQIEESKRLVEEYEMQADLRASETTAKLWNVSDEDLDEFNETRRQEKATRLEQLKNTLDSHCENADQIHRKITKAIELCRLTLDTKRALFAWRNRDIESRRLAWPDLLGRLTFDSEARSSEEIEDALIGKPALIALYRRMNFTRWEKIDKSDERNLQRLSDVLVAFGIEIDRPRGEKKVRLNRISDKLVG